MKELLRSPVVAAFLFLVGVLVFVSGGNATVYKWSQTADTNATADASINWAEGMAPSAVNNSARAMMAAVSKWRDDMAGAAATIGSSNAYLLTSSQSFASLSAMSGQRVCFTPNFTSTGAATINVDTLGAKALRAAPTVELSPGALVSGTPYCAVYNNANSEWVVTFVNANTVVPLGGIVDFIGGSVPSSNFVVARGQAISRTTYAALFAMISTIYGAGDGSTTFNIPDLGGRVVAGTEASASRLTSGGSGCTGNSLGSVCGAETVGLSQGNLPNVNFSASGLSVSTTITNGSGVVTGATTVNEMLRGTPAAGQSQISNIWRDGSTNTLSLSSSGTTGSVPSGGSATPVNKQPHTIVLNKLLRVL